MFFHSCNRYNTNRNTDGTLALNHPLKKILHEDIRKNTENNNKKGFLLIEMRWCEWLKVRKEPKVSRFLKTLRSVNAKQKLSFEKSLERSSKQHTLRFLLVDNHTPDNLKEN